MLGSARIQVEIHSHVKHQRKKTWKSSQKSVIFDVLVHIYVSSFAFGYEFTKKLKCRGRRILHKELIQDSAVVEQTSP